MRQIGGTERTSGDHGGHKAAPLIACALAQIFRSFGCEFARVNQYASDTGQGVVLGSFDDGAISHGRRSCRATTNQSSPIEAVL